MQVFWTLSDFADGAYRISLGEHPHYKIPALGFRGIPVGVDARKVVETKTLPVIDIMMVHRKPGLGLAGMGLKQFPAYLNRWDSQQARNEGVFAH